MSKNNSKFGGKGKAKVGASVEFSNNLPPEVIRLKMEMFELAQESMKETLEVLESIRDDDTLNPTARVAAAAQLLKFANDVEAPPKESIEEADLSEIENLSNEKLHELLLKELGKSEIDA